MPLRLYGIPVTEDDARRLIATLLADGGDTAQSAAALITRGLEFGLAATALPIPERVRWSRRSAGRRSTGRALRGCIRATYLGGRLIARDGEIVADQPSGRVLRRER